MGKPSKKRKRQPKVGECAYCGTVGEVTVDHVVPRCLFAKQGNSFIKVDACRPCNLAKSETEDDFRDFVAISYRSETHPNHRRLVEATARSTVRNSSPTGRRVKWARRPLTLIDSGRFRDVYLIPNDPEPMMECVDFIVRGLYYHAFGQRVPDDAEVMVRYVGHDGPSPVQVIYQALEQPPSDRLRDSEGVADVRIWKYVLGLRRYLFVSLDILVGVGFFGYVGLRDPAIEKLANALGSPDGR